MNNLIYFREFIISNFGIQIYAILFKNQKLIYINNFYRYLLFFIPFSLLNYINIFKIIYRKDNIYYVTNPNKSVKIIPLILKFNFMNNDMEDTIDMRSQIKYYNSYVPFKFFINNNKLNNYDSLNIIYISNKELIEKNICIDEYYNKLLYELFI